MAFTWNDYKLEGKPRISFEDWTFKALGRDEEIRNLVDSIAYNAKGRTRQLIKFLDYWGTGKSTYLYNVCFEVNQRLFFDDKLEEPKDRRYLHVLGLFLKSPVRKSEMLDYTYENGLPIPWEPPEVTEKDEIIEKRRESWLECVRKIAFIFLRKALHGIHRKNYEERVISGSTLRGQVVKDLKKLASLKTHEFISKLDKKCSKDPEIYEELGEILRTYIRELLMVSFEEKVGVRRVSKQEIFEVSFPKLLYPTDSLDFTNGYRNLFGQPDKNLRRFTVFEKVCKEASTLIFLTLDEVEDWSQLTRRRIDVDISSIATDAESPISLVVIFRTDILDRLRSASAFQRYWTITDRMTQMSLKKLGLSEVESITEGVLDTARIGETSIFPLTNDFIEKLMGITQRAKKFNVRSYIKSLVRILEASLRWDRESVELPSALLDKEEIASIISGVISEEEEEAVRVRLEGL